LEIYNGINIEDEYIEPNLFNTLLTDKEELIITYVMKGEEGKNLLLLNKYDFRQSLQVQSKFDKYTLSSYISEDFVKILNICKQCLSILTLIMKQKTKK
jgi:hypothetical protein